MKKSPFYLLLLVLVSCGGNVSTTTNTTSTATKTSTVPTTATTAPTINSEYSKEVLDIYHKYDKSFNPNTFKVEKIKELENRDDFINGLDISYIEHLYTTGSVYKNHDNEVEDFYKIIKDNGINTIRVRLFNDINAPKVEYINKYGTEIYSSEFPGGEKNGNLTLETVTKIIADAKRNDFKVLLDLHYSDTWSDPGHQYLPYEWKDYTYSEVKDAIYDYTSSVINHIKASGNTIQVGNEINTGMCFPYGQLMYDTDEAYQKSLDDFCALVNSGIKAVRDNSSDTKIIFHIANGFDAYKENNQYKPSMLKFFQDVEKRNVDYDILGSSFYTFYSEDTPVSTLTDTMNTYVDHFNKPILMVEYSYAYTYERR